MASSNLNKSSGSLLTAAEVNSLLKFDGSDQVGIGTTSPLINLHIQSSATSETGLRLDNTDTGGKSWDIVSTGSSSTSGLAAGGLAFWNADDGAARVSIDSSGRLLVGGIAAQLGGQIEVFNAGASNVAIYNDNTGSSFTAGTALGNIYFGGQDSDSGFETAAAIITAGADETWTSGAHGSFLAFNTVTAGGTTDTERVRIDSSGKISTGGETSPDVDTGGITLNTGSNDGYTITLKNSDIAHGVTSIMETDTYATLGKADSVNGGILIQGIGETAIGYAMETTATTEDTSDTSGSNANMEIRCWLKSGTGQTTQNSTANIFAIRSGNTNTRFLLKENGDIHATNTTITALDTHPDIKLARNLQLATGGKKYKHRVSKKEMKQLVDLKLLSSNGEFQILQGCTAVTLGAVGQLFNMFVNIMSEKLGVTQEECLAASMKYVH